MGWAAGIAVLGVIVFAIIMYFGVADRPRPEP
jgi:hypothetical protein